MRPSALPRSRRRRSTTRCWVNSRTRGSRPAIEVLLLDLLEIAAQQLLDRRGLRLEGRRAIEHVDDVRADLRRIGLIGRRGRVEQVMTRFGHAVAPAVVDELDVVDRSDDVLLASKPSMISSATMSPAWSPCCRSIPRAKDLSVSPRAASAPRRSARASAGRSGRAGDRGLSECSSGRRGRGRRASRRRRPGGPWPPSTAWPSCSCRRGPAPGNLARTPAHIFVVAGVWSGHRQRAPVYRQLRHG